MSCRATLLACLLAAAGCAEPEPEPRELELLPQVAEARQGGDSVMVVQRSRALLRLLQRPDTAGVGRLVDAGFVWATLHPRPTGGSPTIVPALRPDPHYLDRFYAAGLPALDLDATDVQATLQRDAYHGMARADCTQAEHPESCEGAWAVINWRMVDGEWRAWRLTSPLARRRDG